MSYSGVSLFSAVPLGPRLLGPEPVDNPAFRNSFLGAALEHATDLPTQRLEGCNLGVYRGEMRLCNGVN
jgi:hypothetical protein